ncbi:MAG: TlpA family protein disulfide reductase, partial [Nitrospirae bacterium]|nr:TlpA family protein disulfide reductase [Nitrospirota bacterium]
GAYNVRSIPLTYFINPKGEVVGKIFGARQWDQEAAIRYVNSLLQNP